MIRSVRFASLAVGAGLLFCAAESGAQARAAATPRAEIQRLVRAYVEAHNEADATAMMELVVRGPNATSISMGEITRGWEAIRTDADEVTGQAGRYSFAVGTMDVTPLGTNYMLVVAPTTITAAGAQGQVQLRGAMTLVFMKQGQHWRILNEHFSVQPPE